MFQYSILNSIIAVMSREKEIFFQINRQNVLSFNVIHAKIE